MIPPVTEYLSALQTTRDSTGEYKLYFAVDIHLKMVEFTRRHVEAALLATYDKVMKEGMPPSREQILDAYPPKNIK